MGHPTAAGRVYAGCVLLMCDRCRGPIPDDSTFCPMCGRKAPGLDSFDTLRTELPSNLAEAALSAVISNRATEPPPAQGYFPVPRPPDDEPSLVTPPGAQAPPFEPEPRRTLVMGPGGAPLDSMAPTVAIAPYQDHTPPPHFHPPPAYPQPISGRFRIAGPTTIPVTPSPSRIVLGAVLAVIALWLAIWFLPRYSPLDGDEEAALRARGGAAEVAKARRGRLSEEVHVGGNIAAGFMGLAGFGLILTGVLYRAHAEVHCRRCGRPVIAWKGAFGLHCPLGPHHARINWVMVGVTASFWLTLIVMGIAFAVWIS
jgi:hypothetical protein